MEISQSSAPERSLARRLKRLPQAMVAVMFAVSLAGCASTLTRVETWEGDPDAAARAATLKAPGPVDVTVVNSRSVSSFLVDDLPLDYALLPGENEVVFTHKTIWAKSGVVENGESKVHVYKTEPQVVRFTAEAGEEYRFELPKPESRAEAERMAQDFSAVIVAENGQAVATSKPWTPKQAPERTPIPASESVPTGSDSALGRLKATWATATEEEKKAFLRWAFE